MYECRGAEMAVCSVHLPCRGDDGVEATMSVHKCVPLGVGVSRCGLLFPRGVRMCSNRSMDNTVGFSMCFH